MPGTGFGTADVFLGDEDAWNLLEDNPWITSRGDLLKDIQGHDCGRSRFLGVNDGGLCDDRHFLFENSRLEGEPEIEVHSDAYIDPFADMCLKAR